MKAWQKKELKEYVKKVKGRIWTEEPADIEKQVIEWAKEIKRDARIFKVEGETVFIGLPDCGTYIRGHKENIQFNAQLTLKEESYTEQGEYYCFNSNK